jgi:uncharacterized membrane protein YecN with MAPEG domain
MKQFFSHLFKWAVYTVGFFFILSPVAHQFNFSNWFWFSIALIIGFFAGILNTISGTLKSINNQLRGKQND